MNYGFGNVPGEIPESDVIEYPDVTDQPGIDVTNELNDDVTEELQSDVTDELDVDVIDKLDSDVTNEPVNDVIKELSNDVTEQRHRSRRAANKPNHKLWKRAPRSSFVKIPFYVDFMLR